jgi:glycosyltransferase involved in cell wall biosynthesis
MSLLLDHYRTFASTAAGKPGPADIVAVDGLPLPPSRPAENEPEYLPARFEASDVVVDIVVPVYNEAHVLAASVERLHDFLSANLPSDFRLTLVDNASTDGTWAVITDLRDRLPSTAGMHLHRKGRGLALKTAWGRSDARVLAYMDVDLSTDLGAVLPLLAPLISGHSDLAIGSRLAHGARVVRGRKRDLISRSYNRLLRMTLRARFTDAQCGFKAITAEAAHLLLPLVADDGWFFDTELLILAERADLRVYEVPVDWVDDPDTRVDIVDTAVKDIQGILRLRGAFARNALPLAEVSARLGRTRPLRRETELTGAHR